MEKLDRIKNFFMGFLTFICVVVLTSIVVAFPVKKVSEKYLKEKKIKQLINDINFVDLFINENIDSEHFRFIKSKLTDSGIPSEAVDEFMKTEPVKEYTEDILSESINNTMNGKDTKLVENGEIYTFLEKNISDISTELQEKNVPYSDKLNEEKQKEFLNSVKERVPDIENKINELQDKINDKIKSTGYLEDIELALKIVRIIYGPIMDILLISLIIIFIIGIMITRKSIINSFKWVGIAYVISSLILMSTPKLAIKSYKYIDKLPKTFAVYIKNASKNMANSLNEIGKIYIIVGGLLIAINLIIYFIQEKLKYRHLKNNIEITKIK